MIVNRSAPPGPIVPSIAYRDVPEAIEWLCGAFGFVERLRTPPDSDGTIHHAQLAVGEGSVILTGQPHPKASFQNLMVYVKDVDAHFALAQQFGANVMDPPHSAAFGEKQYSVEDLAGYRWTFSQSIADVKPEDWGATVSKIVNRVALLPRPRLCYVEIPASDLQQSMLFYEGVFGWNVRGRDGDRPSFDDATGNISGAWVTGRPPSRELGMLLYIWVDDIDATLNRVVQLGGEVVDRQHLDAPGGEWIARFRDPSGNLLGLYQEGSH